MAAYMIAEIEVKDREVYDDYVKQVPDVVARYGGQYLVRVGRVVPLAGGWNPERIIVIEFPSLEDAQRCFYSEEYQRIAPLREASTISRGVLIETAEPTVAQESEQV